MRVSDLRARVSTALDVAMRTEGAGAIGLSADHAKAVGVALAGMREDANVASEQLVVSTSGAGTILGFHPEHVRRIIRAGRLPAARIGGDYRIRIDDLWPLLEARHQPPGQRRSSSRADADPASGDRKADRDRGGHAGEVAAS